MSADKPKIYWIRKLKNDTEMPLQISEYGFDESLSKDYEVIQVIEHSALESLQKENAILRQGLKEIKGSVLNIYICQEALTAADKARGAE